MSNIIPKNKLSTLKAFTLEDKQLRLIIISMNDLLKFIRASLYNGVHFFIFIRNQSTQDFVSYEEYFVEDISNKEKVEASNDFFRPIIEYIGNRCKINKKMYNDQRRGTRFLHFIRSYSHAYKKYLKSNCNISILPELVLYISSITDNLREISRIFKIWLDRFITLLKLEDQNITNIDQIIEYNEKNNPSLRNNLTVERIHTLTNIVEKNLIDDSYFSLPTGTASLNSYITRPAIIKTSRDTNIPNIYHIWIRSIFSPNFTLSNSHISQGIVNNNSNQLILSNNNLNSQQSPNGLIRGGKKTRRIKNSKQSKIRIRR
jgi:hypothetical protein